MVSATIHNFNGMQISLNSLKSATEFKMFVLDNKPDVICIQEMHLKPRQNYYLPGYNVDRRDRLDKRLGV